MIRTHFLLVAAWVATAAVAAVPALAAELDLDTGAAAAAPEAAAPDPARSLLLGKDEYAAGRYERARQQWERAAATYAARGDRRGQIQSANFLVLVCQKLGDWEAARTAMATGQQLLEAGDIPPQLQAQAHNAAAGLALATGDEAEAIAAWKRAETLYQQSGDRLGELGSQLNRARVWQQLGDARRAERLLVATTAEIAAEFPDSLLQLRGWQLLGSVRFTRNDFRAARTTLEEALDLAARLQARDEARSLQLTLASLLQATGDFAGATARVAAATEMADSPRAQMTAMVTQLQGQIARSAWLELPPTVAAARGQLAEIPPGPAKMDAILALAGNLLRAPTDAVGAFGEPLVETLNDAAEMAADLGDRRRLAQVRLLRARWQSRQGQTSMARSELQATIQLAQSLKAPEIVAPAAWELGRLLAAAGERTAAIAAYKEAVSELGTLRGDLAAVGRDVQFSFRQTVEPVYRELVALLLTDAPNPDELQQARLTIEALRLAELDNFFREACLDAQRVAIDNLDPEAAVIYPILLPDRLAAIVSRANAPLQYYSLPLPRHQVEGEVEALLSSLHPAADNQERLRQSEMFYDWLVRPAEDRGWLQDIKTLVFVLDGNLRKLPVAALHDGERYLIERYSVALSQGLQLLQPRARSSRRRSLAAGLTEPRASFAALPGVSDELQRLEATLPTAVLMDEAFTRDRLARAVTRRRANILHIATHGRFGSRPEETFLQAWDGPIDLRALDELLLSRSAAGPGDGLDLLVLSACQTAAGDDLAILGLAGFAVSSGAQSTVATLWQVRDRSTAVLMGHFYDRLSDPANSKAFALRRAQQKLLADDRYSHPYFWSPFVLVGHWK